MTRAPRARNHWTGWRRIFPALAILTASLCGDARGDDAELGRGVYEDFCVTCHGRDMVNPGGVTFDLRKFPKDNFERFRNAVLNGKPPAMPPWRDKVSDEDVKLLWAYVRDGG
jgi:mono/diheme cytochrome c family protein